MHYKTIVLGLIEQNPELHERLRQSRSMLTTVNRIALELKERHEALIATLNRSKPGTNPSRASGEAMEIAVRELEGRFASESRPGEAEEPSLDAAMNHLLRHTPRA